MLCVECGNEIKGKRSDAKYCSNACTLQASRKRKRSSNFRPSRGYEKQIVSTFENAITGNIPGLIKDGLNGITNPNEHPGKMWFKVIITGLSAGYGFFTCDRTEEPLKRTFKYGASALLLTSGMIYLIDRTTDYYKRQKENETLQINEISEPVNNYPKLVSSNDLKYMPIKSIKYDGAFGALVGEEVNYNYFMLIYGQAGSGKSHLATEFSSYLDKTGKVLYVLAEEDYTDSFQKRFMKYDVKNTDTLSTRNPDEVLYYLQPGHEYKYLVIDSLNGLLNYREQLELIKKFRNCGLYGIIIINQVNKEGQFVGSNELLHESDIEIVVNNGIAITKKNRFAPGGKVYSIFASEENKVVPDYEMTRN